jgi:hypothetical protein
MLNCMTESGTLEFYAVRMCGRGLLAMLLPRSDSCTSASRRRFEASWRWCQEPSDPAGNKILAKN